MRSHPNSKSKLRDQEFARPFRNFRPRKAVGVLGSTELDGSDYLKTWMLARLLAWMILDQPRSNQMGTPRIRRANANQIGRVVIGALIDFRFQSAGYDEAIADKSFGQLHRLFVVCRGYRGLQH